MTEDSSLNRAVALAAWLIRTRRQPAPTAHFIAGRKFGVDLHDVARLVGSRGGRKRAKLKRQTANTTTDELTGPGSGCSGPPSNSTAQHLLSVEIQETQSLHIQAGEPAVVGRFADGPCAGSTAAIARQWFSPNLKNGDIVRFEVEYEPLDGKPWPVFLARLGQVSQ